MVSTPGDVVGREEVDLYSVFGDGVRFVDVSSRMAGTDNGAGVGRGYQSVGGISSYSPWTAAGQRETFSVITKRGIRSHLGISRQSLTTRAETTEDSRRTLRLLLREPPRTTDT